MPRDRSRIFAGDGHTLGSKTVLGLVVLGLGLLASGCGREPEAESFGPHSRFLRLTSGYSEIVVDSAKIPGYWAVQADGETFFLYIRDTSFEKGDVIRVDGDFGSGVASVFDEETRVYRRDMPTKIFIVWKAAREEMDKTVRPVKSPKPSVENKADAATGRALEPEPGKAPRK